jgi:large subunit ribosomal protein L25
MKQTFELKAEVRTDMGKGASRRLRRTQAVPAIIYGGSSEPQSITLAQNELLHHLDNEAFYSHVLTMNVNGKTEQVVLRDLQRHPYKAVILHADFMRIDNKSTLTMNVPLHFLNEETAVGVKKDGGIVSRLMNELEVSCLAKDLPEYIEIDLIDLHVGDSVHLSEVKMPEGVELVALSHGDEHDHDQAVVSIVKPRAVVEESTDEAAADLTAEPDEASSDDEKE